MKPPALAGRVCVGVAVAASGLMQVINARFVRLVSWPADWVSARAVAAIAVGVVLIAIGVALAVDRQVRRAALALAALLGMALLLRMPEILGNPGAGFVWTNPAKVLALMGGAVLLADGMKRGPELAAVLLAVFLLVGGVQHFVYAAFVETLVPAWIPPGPRFWTLFTAVALLAGGTGLLVPATRQLAGLLVGVMIFLWVLLLHVPRSVEMKSAFELAGVFEALALGGVAWSVAARTEKSGRTA